MSDNAPAHITATFQSDDSGWWTVACECGWEQDMLPDDEMAADAFGEHCYLAGHSDGEASVERE